MAQFDLCPKCGAVARDGECSSCGYKIPGIYGKNKETSKVQYNTYAPDNAGQNTGYDETANNQNVQSQQLYHQTTWVQDEAGRWVQVSNAEQQPAKPVSTVGIKTAVVLCIATMIIVVCALAYGVRKVVFTDGSHPQSSGDVSISVNPGNAGNIEPDKLFKYGSYDGNLRDILFENADFFANRDWEELDQDTYDGTDYQAYEFDNYIDTGVSYRVEEDNWYYYNFEGNYNKPEENFYLPQGITMVGNYFRLVNTGLANEDEINDLILRKSMQIANMAEVAAILSDENETITIANNAYVAYMDEDVISILYHGMGYRDSSVDGEESYLSVMSQISSLNIDLHTGKEISAEETFDFGGDFYQFFKERCLSQNGAAMDYYEDDELISALTNDYYVVWAYTPLGLEVGVNRPGYSGWSTITLTDYEQFYKVY